MNILKRITSGSNRSVAVKKNIIGSLIIKGFSILISLLIVPVTLGYVNSEMYGVWLTLSSIMMWIYFFDVGFTLGLRNKLTEALANNDYLRGKKLVSTTYLMMISIFFPLCIIFELIIPYLKLSTLLNVNATYEPQLQITMKLLILFCCLQMIVNVISSVIAAYQKVALSSLFSVIGQAISLIVIYCLTLFYKQSSLAILAFSISLPPILVTIIASLFLFKYKLRNVSPSLKYFDKSLIKDLFSLGAKFFLIQFQVIILYQCTNILISNLSGPEQVTEYNLAYKYLGVIMMIFSLIVGPLWPAFTDAYTRKDFVWMRGIYKKMVKIFILLALALILMTIISPLVFKLWIGDKAHVSWSMTIIVALYILLYTWDTLQVQMINGIGAIKLQSYVTLIGLFCHIPLSLILGNYLGAKGVVLSMSIINSIYILFFTYQINLIINEKGKGIWIA